MRKRINIDGVYSDYPEVNYLKDLIAWANSQIEKHKELIKQCEAIIKENNNKNQTTLYDLIEEIKNENA